MLMNFEILLPFVLLAFGPWVLAPRSSLGQLAAPQAAWVVHVAVGIRPSRFESGTVGPPLRLWRRQQQFGAARFLRDAREENLDKHQLWNAADEAGRRS
jgi:hypothetical protein